MPDAFIYDAMSAPLAAAARSDGSLHEVTALNLASQALAAHQGSQQARPRAGR